MARLLIPTRNRPTSLLHVLNFIAKFYSKTEILIADGGYPEYQAQNRENLSRLKGILSIEYAAYPEEMPLFDRLRDVITASSDPFFIIGSDDDFPMLDVFEKAERKLCSNPDASTALGALLHFRLFDDVTMNARIDPARPISAPTAMRRMLNFSKWPNSTVYAISRRELLIERYKRAKFMMPGFFDYAVGLLDCAMGRILALPTIGFICTRNYNHSYLRVEAPLFYLRKSRDVLKLRDRIRDDLMEYGQLDKEEADRIANVLINRRVATLTGVQPYKLIGFDESPIFNNGVVQTQFELFNKLFVDNNSVREKYIDKLRYISNSIIANAKSEDNKGEKKFYETLN